MRFPFTQKDFQEISINTTGFEANADEISKERISPHQSRLKFSNNPSLLQLYYSVKLYSLISFLLAHIQDGKIYVTLNDRMR